MKTRSRTVRRRWATAALAGCTVVAALAASAPATAGAADAAPYRITGLERAGAQNPTSGVPNHTPVKKVTVACPPGKVVLGGAVSSTEFPASGVSANQLALTQTEPGLLPDGRYTWSAKVAETSVGTPHPWRMQVIAICADRPPRYDLESASTDVSTNAVQETHAVCAGGRAVLGGGARVRSLAENPGVSLQVNRVDALGGLMRAQAAAHPRAGSAPEWGLTSVVICADKPSGWEMVNDLSTEPASAPVQDEDALCTGNRRTLSVGAALTADGDGRAGLHVVGAGVRRGFVRGVEHFPTNLNWGPVLVRMICADADPETD